MGDVVTMSAPNVYVSFDASRSKNPALTDLRYYFLLRAWARRGSLGQMFTDVHEMAPSGKPVDLRSELARRLEQSDVLLLILSEQTRSSRGWLSWEIEFGAGVCGLPMICSYAGRDLVDPTAGHPEWWPMALRQVMASRQVQPLHVPFRSRALAMGLRRWTAGHSPPLSAEFDCFEPAIRR